MATRSTRQSKSSKKGGSRGKRTRKRSKHGAARAFLTPDQATGLMGVALIVLGLMTGLAMLPTTTPTRVQPWLDLLARLFGTAAPLVIFVMLALGGWLLARYFVRIAAPPGYRLIGFLLIVLAAFGFLGFVQQWRSPGVLEGYGGLAGHYIYLGVALAIGQVATPVALFFMTLLGLLLLFEVSLASVARRIARLWPEHPATKAPSPQPSLVNLEPEANVQEVRSPTQLAFPAVPQLWEQARSLWERLQEGLRKSGGPLPRTNKGVARESAHKVVLPNTPWKLPRWRTLLDESTDTESDWEDIRRKTHIIEETLGHFGIPAQVVEVNRGPTVTQYGVEPGFQRKRIRGEDREIKVKVSAITNLHNDLALALAAPRIRIEAPVPGQSFVGIEVPNDQATSVTLRSTMESEEFVRLRAPLAVALGRDVMGNAVVADLARMPHLLIAGATGSGKSVCINSIVCCLLCHNTPDQLKLMMVDPKMVELIGYNDIPHLIVPVVTDIERVVGLLRWTVNEMERRYKIFSAAQVRNLEAYNARAVERGEKPLPYLVLVIDELADLMMAAPDQVEAMICRLAQMARATGIHMILATQRPSVDVVTGLIKANFPARVAFGVTSGTDSRVILDINGAETLLGRGDMLYMAPDASGLKRAQGCFVSDQELERINRFWRDQATFLKQPRASGAPRTREQGAESVAAVQPVLWDELLDDEDEEEDELLPRARELVAERGRASISLIQRRLRVGYARAARIVDLLEEEGTIGSSEGPGKHRDVLIDEDDPEEDE